jgi:hypothetical protein
MTDLMEINPDAVLLAAGYGAVWWTTTEGATGTDAQPDTYDDERWDTGAM